MTYRILVIGSKDWEDLDTVRHAIFETWKNAGSPKNTVLVSGGAEGAEIYASICGDAFGFTVERHKANQKLERSAGAQRNQRMVGLGANVCLVFARVGSKGTANCINLVKKARIPIENYAEYPDLKEFVKD